MKTITASERVRYEDVPKRCDQRLVNEEARKSGKPHSWIPYSTLFPTRWRASSRVPIDEEQIPNWSWCNFCGIIDKTRPICTADVQDDYNFYRCNNRGVVEQPVDKWNNSIKGLRWYCKVHDPVAMYIKRAARDLAYRQEREAADLARKRRDAEAKARNDLAEAALETLQWMEASGIYQDDEWAGAIYRRIGKAKAVLDG